MFLNIVIIYCASVIVSFDLFKEIKKINDSYFGMIYRIRLFAAGVLILFPLINSGIAIAWMISIIKSGRTKTIDALKKELDKPI